VSFSGHGDVPGRLPLESLPGRGFPSWRCPGLTPGSIHARLYTRPFPPLLGCPGLAPGRSHARFYAALVERNVSLPGTSPGHPGEGRSRRRRHERECSPGQARGISPLRPLNKPFKHVFLWKRPTRPAGGRCRGAGGWCRCSRGVRRPHNPCRVRALGPVPAGGRGEFPRKSAPGTPLAFLVRTDTGIPTTRPGLTPAAPAARPAEPSTPPGSARSANRPSPVATSSARVRPRRGGCLVERVAVPHRAGRLRYLFLVPSHS
jgi:hypothetical protein